MASSSTESIDHVGMLLNMLSYGFTTPHCLNELIDNSLGADATSIRIILTTNGPTPQFVISDNGTGMTLEELRQAYVLHNRKPATNQKQGRFGIGGNHALVQFTQLKGKTLTLTRPKEDMTKRFELEIDFDETKRQGRYDVIPHRLTVDNLAVWEKYAINPSSHGTVILIDLDNEIAREMEKLLQSSTVKENMRYALGEIYCAALEQGTEIEIVHNEDRSSISPHDFLQWGEIEEKNKKEMIFHVYKKKGTGEVVLFYRASTKKGTYDPNGPITGYRKNGKEGKIMKGFVPSPLPDESEAVYYGPITIQVAYHANWIGLKKNNLEEWGITVPEGERDEGIQALRYALSGTAFNRNGRQLDRFPLELANSGDKAERPIIDGTNCTISFQARQEDQPEDIIMDDIFGVRVDKSRLEKELIEKIVLETAEKIRKELGHEIYKREKQNASDLSDTSEASVMEDLVEDANDDGKEEEQPRIVKRTPPARFPRPVCAPASSPPASSLPASSLPASSLPAPVRPPAPSLPAPVRPPVHSIPAPVRPPAPAPSTPTPPATAPPAPSLPAPPAPAPSPPAPAPSTPTPSIPHSQKVTKIQIQSHSRTTSKSPSDIWKLLEETRKLLTGIDITSKIAGASTDTVPGMAEFYNQIQEMNTFLSKD